MEQFKQKKFFITKTFTFKEDGVEFISKDFDGIFSKLISYDDMKPRKECRVYTETYPKLNNIAMFLIGIGLVKFSFFSDNASSGEIYLSHFIWLSGICFSLLYFTLQIHYYLIELEDETQLFVLLDNPNKLEMEAFVDKVFEKRKESYRKKYFYIDYESSKEKQIDKMKWLKSESIISENEYLVVLDEINDHLD